MTHTGTSGFIHDAFFHDSTEALVAEAAPFLREGLAAGDDVALVCTDENNDALADALGNDDRILYLPRSQVYEKAVSAIEFARDFLGSRPGPGGARVRVVAQIDFGASSRSWDEWRRYEAAVNVALAPFPLWSVCAYDTQALPDRVLTTGRLTHPHLRRAGRREPNPGYVDPTELLRLSDTDLKAPRGGPVIAVTDAYDLHRLDGTLRRFLEDKAVDRDKSDDLVLSIKEVATNGLLHGTPPVTVRLGASLDGVVCTVTDQGLGFDDPLAGYVRGAGHPLPEGQFGLWLARRLCDEVVTVRTPGGFTVGLMMRT